RRRDVGPVVDVLIEKREADTAPDQADGVDVQEQGGRAALLVRLLVEDVRRAERQGEPLDAVRMLVQQEAEIRRGRPGECQCEQHLPKQKVRPRGRRQRCLTAAASLSTESFASPKSITVFGFRKSGFSIPAKPGFMLRFRTTTCCAWSTLRIGIP